MPSNMRNLNIIHPPKYSVRLDDATCGYLQRNLRVSRLGCGLKLITKGLIRNIISKRYDYFIGPGIV